MLRGTTVAWHNISNGLFQDEYGLVYADLDLVPGQSGSRFIIRGIENRNNYAIIDLTKKEPLPLDDYEDEKHENTV